MRQDEAIPTLVGWAVQKAPDGHFTLRTVQEFSTGVHSHSLL